MTYRATTGAAPSTPASGKAELYADSADKLWKQIDDTGTIRALGVNSPCSIIATSGAINNTETIIVGGTNNCRIYANQLKAGTVIRACLEGTCTTTVANASTWRVRVGTLGTTGDTAIFTAANSVAGTTGTNIPFVARLVLTVRSIGASAAIVGYLELGSTGVTGLSAVTWQAVEATVLTHDSTVANWLSVSYVAAAATTTCTFRNAFVEIVKA
jgi:hypothetical protein